MRNNTFNLAMVLVVSSFCTIPTLALDPEFDPTHTATPPPSSSYLTDTPLMALIEKTGQEFYPEDTVCADGHVNPRYEVRLSIQEGYTHLLLLPYAKPGYDKLLAVMISPTRRDYRIKCEWEDWDFYLKYHILWVGLAKITHEWELLSTQPTPLAFGNNNPSYFDQLTGGEWVLIGVAVSPYLSNPPDLSIPMYFYVMRNDQLIPLCWAPARGKPLDSRAIYDAEYSSALGCTPVFSSQRCHSFARDRQGRITAIYEHDCEGRTDPDDEFIVPGRKYFIDYYSLKQKTFVQSTTPYTADERDRRLKSKSRRNKKRKAGATCDATQSGSGEKP